jgi:hypothetical protein
MSKIKTIIAAGAMSLLFSGTAMAQSFTYDVVWQPVENIGGMTGPDGQMGGGGTVNGTYSTKYEDGSMAKGTVRCVGMQQPGNSLFAIHLSCTAKDTQGTSSLVYGCNYIGKAGPETPLGCVGAFEAKDGETKGQRGQLTMNWYSATQSRGTGQFNASQ